MRLELKIRKMKNLLFSVAIIASLFTLNQAQDDKPVKSSTILPSGSEQGSAINSAIAVISIQTSSNSGELTLEQNVIDPAPSSGG